MNRLAIAFLILASCGASFAQSSRLAFIPYRKIDGQYYDLTARYAWLKERLSGPYRPPASKPGTPSKPSSVAPLSSWRGDESLHVDGAISTSYEVVQVIGGGLIVEETRSNYILGHDVTDHPFFLRNYPGANAVAEGDKIVFLAMKHGVWKYDGRSLPLWDCGIPVSAAELEQWRKSQHPPNPSSAPSAP